MNYCKFLTTCDQVTEDQWDLTFTVFDSLLSKDFKINASSDFLIPGSSIGDSNDHCFMPIFRSTDGMQNVWYLGNFFMYQYYTVFDASPLT